MRLLNLLVACIMRMLAGMDLFEETGVVTFKSTPAASAYVTGAPWTDAVMHMYMRSLIAPASTY